MCSLNIENVLYTVSTIEMKEEMISCSLVYCVSGVPHFA